MAIPFVPFSRHCEEGSDAAIQSGAGGGPEAGLLRSARNDGVWDRALAELRDAEAALRAFEARTAGAPDEEQEAVEQEMDERLDALGPALLRLLGAPAPDLCRDARRLARACGQI
ncbi:MAG: hypothetical protein ABIW83_07105 [Allosphingosinicella sp.]